MRKLLSLCAIGLGLATGVANAGGPYTGCSTCDSGACKPSFFDKFKCHKDGCDSGHLFNKFKGDDGCGGVGAGSKLNDILHWYRRPCGNPAPTWRITGYPIGFPTHPYARSPRDYFMVD